MRSLDDESGLQLLERDNLKTAGVALMVVIWLAVLFTITLAGNTDDTFLHYSK